MDFKEKIKEAAEDVKEGLEKGADKIGGAAETLKDKVRRRACCG